MKRPKTHIVLDMIVYHDDPMYKKFRLAVRRLVKIMEKTEPARGRCGCRKV